LGEIIALADTDIRTTFLGGLDTGGIDGDFAITWKDDLMQVIFHVATLMPNK
jgi:tuberous sclerosis protein 2